MQKVKELKELMLPVGNATRAGTAREKQPLPFSLIFSVFAFLSRLIITSAGQIGMTIFCMV